MRIKTMGVSETQANYDSPWKEALEEYFEAFLAFFFPTAHREIDWERGYEFLEQELLQIVGEGDIGNRFVDKHLTSPSFPLLSKERDVRKDRVRF